jgi:hypothetical protein
MRSVSGFERPALQWLFVGIALVLIGVAAAEGVALMRLRAQVAAARAAELNSRIELDQSRAQTAREQASREALTLELARQRGSGAPPTQPTLTLSPSITRSAQPPEATVAKPAENQSIQLRLVLPAHTESADARYTIVIRTWSGGEMIWSRGNLGASTVDKKGMVTAFISGDVFAPGAYEVVLTRAAGSGGPADVASYEIAVHR